jgi:imidazolonepropionase-like amidohydrolase
MPHGDYIPEFELYVKRLGIPPLDVLRWATRNGAELMGLGESAGTIEVGKLADLVIVQGDPLVDISCLGRPENLCGILLNGCWIKNALPSRADSTRAT